MIRTIPFCNRLQVSLSNFHTYNNLHAPKLWFTLWRTDEIGVDNFDIEAKSAKYLTSLDDRTLAIRITNHGMMFVQVISQQISHTNSFRCRSQNWRDRRTNSESFRILWRLALINCIRWDLILLDFSEKKNLEKINFM